MILTIPGGAEQQWGTSPIYLNLDDVIVPDGAGWYNVMLKGTYLDGTHTGEVIFDVRIPLNNYDTYSTYLDISPYLTAPGNVKIEYGQTYSDGFNHNLIVIEWVNDIPNISIVDGTSVSVGGVVIPGGIVQLSGNPVVIMVKATAGMMAGKENYRLALKITCQALMGSPFVEEIAPGTDLSSVFEISGFVDQPVEHTFDYPAKGACNPHDALVFHVTLDTGEVYIDANGDRIVAWNGDLTDYPMQIIKGRLRTYELALLNEIGKSFNTEYIRKGKFLTHLPDKMKVAPGQIVKLWLLSKYPAIHAASWWCHVYYNPHGYYLDYETPVVVYSQLLTGEYNLDPLSGLLEFNIEPAFLGFYLNNPPTAKILAYKFWLEDIAGIITEQRTFIIDDQYYEQSFTFYYLNPLSGIDMIWLTGEHKEGLKTESETAYRPVPFGSGSKVGSMISISTKSQRTWEMNTGFKSREELLAMRDFLEAKERWMVDPDNENKLIPVLIESGDFGLYDSQNDLRSLDIKIMEAH